MHVGEIAVEQVGDEPRLAGAEDFFGNLAARVEARVAQRVAVASTRELEVELPAMLAEHDEAAIGARNLDGRIENERKHLIEDAPGAQRTQPFEQRRDLTEI